MKVDLAYVPGKGYLKKIKWLDAVLIRKYDGTFQSVPDPPKVRWFYIGPFATIEEAYEARL